MRRTILPVLLGLSVAMAAPLSAQHGNGKKEEHAGGQAHGSSGSHGNSGSHAQGGESQARGNSGKQEHARPRTERRATQQGATRSQGRNARSTTRGSSGNGNSTVRRTTGNNSAIRWAERREHYNSFGRVATRGKNGVGPSFCQSGAGHPQFGRQWCLDKGFGLGSGHWSRATWGDVRFQTTRRTTGSIARDVLVGVLGNVMLNRLAYGASGPVTGQWVSYGSSSPSVLQLRSSGAPLAELTDYNRDGRVDLVLVNLGQ
jgi:hypothetical protein